MRSTARTNNVNSSSINFYKKNGEFKNDDHNKYEFSKTTNKFMEKDFYHAGELLAEKEKLQETIENLLKNKDLDNPQFKDLMATYVKKHSHYESKYVEDIMNTRKIEPIQIMKGIGDIKHKIDYLDLKENYLDSFLSIGKFEQGATLMKIK